MIGSYPILWKIAEAAASIWIQRKTLSGFNQITQKSMLTYVEAVKALRSAVIVLCAVFVFAIFICASIAVLIHAILTLQHLEPEQLAWIEIGIAGAIIFLAIIGIIVLTSESLWVKTFKIDQMVGEISESEKKVIGQKLSA